MKTTAIITGLALAAGCATEPAAEPGEELSGGGATVFDVSAAAFGHPLPDLDRDAERRFFRGRALFRDEWVTAPASTNTRDGLGPLFNTRACESCHDGDGRGRPPEPGEAMTSMLIRLSVPGAVDDGGPLAEPRYGGQLQPFAIAGVPAEGKAVVTYTEVARSYADGEAYSLRRPDYQFEQLGYGDMDPAVLLSPRVAPMVFGLGLLQAVPAETITALAAPDDRDGDGISGRVNLVPDAATGARVLGRFGLKANQPTIHQQTAGAFRGDIGMTSSLFATQNCTSAQAECAAATGGGEPEVADVILDDVAFYGMALAVPARRDWDDPTVLRGKQLFGEAGCATCHAPVLQTGPVPALPALADQTIRPYTDLLLHDMGPDLADGRPDYDATGTEWRTPPLWGLGLLRSVNGHVLLLHDGRARGFAEAILWHGGEAETSREQFRAMAAGDRAALLRFLESL